ncbi:hypothetical protein H2248_002000 [Termitomyces sp. 'cryptogamus']|nr:hypothetical protein H2248_002000 [Termitomyces sp. 'cryptogamus']
MKVGRNKARYQYLKQAVKINGLENGVFAMAQQAAEELKDHFDRVFPEGQLQYNREETFDISNRFFTPIKDTVNEDIHIPFCKNTNPQG